MYHNHQVQLVAELVVQGSSNKKNYFIMNPSSNGWFKKLLKLAEKENDCIISSKNELYHKLKSVGFIYGSNVSLLFESLKNKDFNQEERCKINYILSLFYIKNFRFMGDKRKYWYDI